MDANQLVIARYDTGRGVWVPLFSDSNIPGRAVTAVTGYFSLFQIMEARPAETLANVKAFPNPFRPSLGHNSMTFSNPPAGARIRIYTLSGALIRELTANSSGMASWDGKNRFTSKAAVQR